MKTNRKMSRALLRAVTRMWLLSLLAALTSATALAAVIPVCFDHAEPEVMRFSALPGDTLVMCNGNWRNKDIIFEGIGDEGPPMRPITLRAQQRGRVILDGSSRLRMGGRYLVADGLYFKDGSLAQFGGNQAIVEFRARGNHCHNCRLTNSVIENYNPGPIDREQPDANAYKWVALYGTRNRVDRCTFTGKTNVGSLLVVVRRTESNQLTAEPQHHRIDHNYFENRPALGRDARNELINGGDIITIGESGNSLSDSVTTVESNVFERCNGEVELISSKSGRNVFRNNTFRNSAGMLTLRHGNRARVDGNFFFGRNTFDPCDPSDPFDPCDTGGIRVIGENHLVINNYFSGLANTTGANRTWWAGVTLFNGSVENPVTPDQLRQHARVKNAVIAFNTFVENAQNLIIGGGRTAQRTLAPLNSKVANNVIVKVMAPGIDCLINVADRLAAIRYEGNMMFAAGGCLVTPPVPDDIFEIDPDLVPSEDGLYRPGSGSQVIDRAVGDYPSVTRDMDGQPRDDGFKDVGADEVSNAPITRRPLTRQDVGASWAR